MSDRANSTSSKTSHSLLAVFTAVVAGVGMGYFFGAGQPTVNESQRRTLEQLSARLGRIEQGAVPQGHSSLRAADPELSARLARLEGNAARGEAQSPAQEPTLGAEVEPSALASGEPDRSVPQVVDQLEQRMANERADPRFEDAFRSRLVRSFDAAALDGVRLAGAACKGHLCAIDVEYAHDAKVPVAMQQMIARWLGPRQPCGFHVQGIAGPQASDGHPTRQRVFIDCAGVEGASDTPDMPEDDG